LLRLLPPRGTRIRHGHGGPGLVRAPLGWSDGRCVQGAGTYSPRGDDTRLLGIPCSRGRVAAPDPNYDGVWGLPSPLGVGALCPRHCSSRVARGIQAILTCRGPLPPPPSRWRSPYCARAPLGPGGK